ncbi:MAG TPA: hypothetical protein VGK83_03875 [Acidimicrobiia bacterium]
MLESRKWPLGEISVTTAGGIIQVGPTFWANSCAMWPAERVRGKSQGQLVANDAFEVNNSIPGDGALVFVWVPHEKLRPLRLDRPLPFRQAANAAVIGHDPRPTLDEYPLVDGGEVGEGCRTRSRGGFANVENELLLSVDVAAKAGMAKEVGHLETKLAH